MVCESSNSNRLRAFGLDVAVCWPKDEVLPFGCSEEHGTILGTVTLKKRNGGKTWDERNKVSKLPGAGKIENGICAICFVGGVFSFVQMIDAYKSWSPLLGSSPGHSVYQIHQSKVRLLQVCTASDAFAKAEADFASACLLPCALTILDIPWLYMRRWFPEGIDFLMQVCPLG